ncbi:probable glycosyltransferase At5g03795 isoform X2 [Spinacia oleracea]|uniref:Probable glycosyltransferase At5g03795 isoform X2 n=1 Tax=Spinacia oleracea TaxID=3562 RepID=A0ABM3QPL7_SPIOL|nr:probable glycosyltransferase At5g03795 isoform X2 [Spinacia oleracea]
MGYLYLSPLGRLLLCITIPLILVSGFVCFNGGTNSSIWVFNSSNYHTKTLSTKDEVLRSEFEGVEEEASVLAEDSVFEDKTLNETHGPLTIKVKIEKVATDLEKLEIGLQKARAAIKEAKHTNLTYYDPDFKPVGPIYWNSNAFQRSYLEMEKQFKVYVYEEGESPLFHNGPCKSIYSSEGNFIHLMEINHQFRTKNPNKAHVFFLPFSGPIASFSVPNLKENSIRVLCNANTSEGFQPRKDVSLPEINLQTGAIDGFVGGPSPSHRSILAFFAGGNHGPIRPFLLEHWGNKTDQDMRIHTYLPKNVSYYDMLRNSKFCICPSGYEVASPRVVEAIYTGCVPVLISDNYVPPFNDVLNWKAFSVEVSVKDIPKLKTILLSISTRRYLNMYRILLQVRRHFEVHHPPKRYDFFHMILHSVWLRRLNLHVHDP